MIFIGLNLPGTCEQGSIGTARDCFSSITYCRWTAVVVELMSNPSKDMTPRRITTLRLPPSLERLHDLDGVATLTSPPSLRLPRNAHFAARCTNLCQLDSRFYLGP